MKKIKFINLIIFFTIPFFSFISADIIDNGKISFKSVEIGDNYFDFEAFNQNLEKIKFSKLFDGKFILLDFTMTDCKGCKNASQELRLISNNYADLINVVSFTIDRKKSAWERYLIRDNVTWISLWDGRGSHGTTCRKYGVKGGPLFFIINPEGIVIDKFYGFYDERLIRKLIEHKIIDNK